MDKNHYLDALKRAMTGLAPEAQAKTLAFYEQRFVDGVAAGRTEAEIAAEQDDPTKIAMTLRANSHLAAFDQKKSPANFVRMAFAAVGLAIFNLFMVVPAAVYGALLMAMYACGLAFYLSGAVVTASGLAGSDELKLNGALRHLIVEAAEFANEDDDAQTRVTISDDGIRIVTEQDVEAGNQHEASGIDEDRDGEEDQAKDLAKDAAKAAKGAETAAKEAGKVAERAAKEAEQAAAGAAKQAVAAARAERAAERAESAADSISLTNGLDDESRATQVFIGIGLVLGGIVMLLLSLVITRFTFIGIKRYVEMNISLLKGN